MPKLFKYFLIFLAALVIHQTRSFAATCRVRLVNLATFESREHQIEGLTQDLNIEETNKRSQIIWHPKEFPGAELRFEKLYDVESDDFIQVPHIWIHYTKGIQNIAGPRLGIAAQLMRVLRHENPYFPFAGALIGTNLERIKKVVKENSEHLDFSGVPIFKGPPAFAQLRLLGRGETLLGDFILNPASETSFELFTDQVFLDWQQELLRNKK